MKLDILAFASHPDDIELGCAGTLISHIAAGKTVGIIDLTKGELGTRGTAEVRLQEADAAAKVMGALVRENLGMADGYFKNDQAHQLLVIEMIRKYRPEIVLANALHDRHPDHGRGSELVTEACFKAGLRMIESIDQHGLTQEPWRPKAVYHYIQDRLITPSFVVDVTPFWEQKMETIRAFKSQFHNPDDTSPNTYISSPEFLDFVDARARELGHAIGVKYGEGFTADRMVGVRSMFDMI
ncbi:bacillithiol biosynthesis deacetylase BshB1 [Pontibacter sp. CAU 1760]